MSRDGGMVALFEKQVRGTPQHSVKPGHSRGFTGFMCRRGVPDLAYLLPIGSDRGTPYPLSIVPWHASKVHHPTIERQWARRRCNALQAYHTTKGGTVWVVDAKLA